MDDHPSSSQFVKPSLHGNGISSAHAIRKGSFAAFPLLRS